MFSVGDIPSTKPFVVGTLRWNPLFQRGGDPWRTITKRLDLFVLNEDGVTPNPVVAANREIEDLRIADSTVVGLGVRSSSAGSL